MIGQTIIHYKILEELGRGGMGVVYLAEDTRLDRQVAIKFLPSHIAGNLEERKRFEIEAKAAAALNHPNIATIHAIEEADEVMFIVMEYIDGQELKNIIKSQVPNPESAINYAIQIAEGLQAAHKRGIIHRDIKSSNIMITREGKVKIMDFGLAKMGQGIHLTKSHTTLGTLSYMSPEQARGEMADLRSDIWSFGVVFYEMLTGELPFPGEYDQAVIYSILNDDPPPVKKLNPEVRSELDHIINKSLQKNREARYTSVTEILTDLKNSQTNRQLELDKQFNIRSVVHRIGNRRIAIPLLAVLILITAGLVWFFDHRAKIQWAEEEALPQIENLVAHSWRDYTRAYDLEVRAEKYIPKNPALLKLIGKSSLKIDITTDPPAAKVYYKKYSLPGDEWKFLGITPIKNMRLPIGIFRWKFEKRGYDTVLAAASTWNINITLTNPLIPNNIFRKLDKQETIPAGMVRVHGAKTPLGEMADFFVDKYEVTNKQYKEFVDSGGYRNKKYWKNEFIKDGKTLSWQEAIKSFIDQTGRPGPATWVAGDYAEGHQDCPVSGVSWYEAAAYAEFAGKELPTETHWGLAMGEPTPMIMYPQLGGFAVFAPFSNFNHKGSIPVGKLPGMTAYGAYDMAGNVREWCLNESPSGRLTRGGAWNDNTYMFKNLSQASPFDRSPRNGFRCAHYAEREKIPDQVFKEMSRFRENEFYLNQRPVSDDIFRVYKEQFSYDKSALNSRLELTDENSSGWIHERVSFNAAYNNERVIAHLFLPQNTSPPYQTVIYFPGSAVSFQKSSNEIENYYEFATFVSFIVKNGRAVLFPVLKGTFERRENGLIPGLLIKQGKLHKFTEYSIQLVEDIKRCTDYLQTRQDIDTNRIAYYGMSWGGGMGAVIPAVEKRFKVSVLISGGFINIGLPEVNAINYMTRVKIPTLMLNGKYDMILPYDKAIKPMFDLLGTPKEDKELKLYNTDHIPPQNEFIKETLAWLDHYLGPVK